MEPPESAPPLLWALAVLISSGSLTSASVTVVLGGTILTGEMVSPREYIEGQAAQMAISSPEEGLHPVAIALRVASDEVSIDSIPPSFFHLRDAMVWQGGERVAIPIGYWQGHLSKVDAFMLGSVGSLEDDDQ